MRVCVCVCRRSVMLKAPSRLSRSTSPRWAKFTALTERACRGSRPGKSSLETLWKCLVRDVELPHGESVLIIFLNGLSGGSVYIFNRGILTTCCIKYSSMSNYSEAVKMLPLSSLHFYSGSERQTQVQDRCARGRLMSEPCVFLRQRE